MHRSRHGEGRGPSQRQLKVGELVRRAVSDVLMRGDLHDPDLERFSITVSEARMSPDLRHAEIFVMPLGGAGEDEVVALLDRNRQELRRAVTREVKLKFSPDLRFRLDRSFDRMDETRRLLADDRVKRDLDEDDAPEDDDGEAR
ncbi:30S ribosome-binding factor RbfA [Albimonas pacifica]|uniref:Ribosome-binding factor A n=1 Tax=Albimonas pacifica TaxID=1114924 RepID=A0A1I3LTV1_9RHOB|nr:30S ribosome-binding factor RbfA [Albimonas pacifica]SFI88152.1 ribosome-binding factor A [Albimonas pacifica]